MMSDGADALMLAVCVGALVLLRSGGSCRASDRLYARGSVRAAERSGAGTLAALSSLSSLLRSGSGLTEGVEELAGRPFATRELTAERCYEALWRCRSPQERPRQVLETALAVAAACRLSEEMGCEAARCIDAAAAACKRSRMIDDLRNTSFSMPKATVRLLSLLPVASIALAEMIGIRALSFLCSSTPGLLCLVVGGAFYAAGMFWMRALLRSGITDSDRSASRRGAGQWRR
ncbi:pilus assembly protein [Bifidobacterium psychraerophilum]|uniref:pilus assembly protein n=1 Tax=Bifidobacterium psychraerophilum TaxID=218140 RepID=UPI0039EC676C